MIPKKKILGISLIPSRVTDVDNMSLGDLTYAAYAKEGKPTVWDGKREYYVQFTVTMIATRGPNAGELFDGRATTYRDFKILTRDRPLSRFKIKGFNYYLTPVTVEVS